MKKNLTELNILTKKHRALVAVLGGGMALAIGAREFLSSVYVAEAETSSHDTPTVFLEASKPEADAVSLDSFAGIVLEARAVFVFDLKKRSVIFSRDENEKFPLASITKLMTALVAREGMSGSAVVTVTADDLSTEGDNGLRAGERWRLEDILKMMLVISSNDAAHAVARFAGSDGQSAYAGDVNLAREHFVQMMNAKAGALGLEHTEFFNESGLDIKHISEDAREVRRAGALGSARDTAVLIAELWGKYPEMLEITAEEDVVVSSQDVAMHHLSNTNEIIGHIPGLVASKTGYTDLAGGNLAVIFDVGVGNPVVAVVLGSTYQGRFDDMQKLVRAVLQHTR